MEMESSANIPRAMVAGESVGAWAQCRGTGEPLQCRAPLSLYCFPSQLGRETLSFSFTVERDIPVRGLKPAQVKVYDYYETGECQQCLWQ